LNESTFLYVYLAALVAVYLAPGPDMALVMATSASRGLRAGVYTAAGIGAARYIHVLGSGLGFSALFSMYPASQDIVKFIGAGYLLFLAWKMVNSRKTEGDKNLTPAPVKANMIRGFFTNLLNPKAIMFCSLLLPQFTSPEHGPLLVQFLWLGGVLVAVGLLFDVIYAFLASRLTVYFLKSVRQESGVGVYIDHARRWLMIVVFTCIALKLLMK